MAGQLEQDSRDRTAGIVQPGHNSQERTGGTDSRGRTVGSGQSGRRVVLFKSSIITDLWYVPIFKIGRFIMPKRQQIYSLMTTKNARIFVIKYVFYIAIKYIFFKNTYITTQKILLVCKSMLFEIIKSLSHKFDFEHLQIFLYLKKNKKIIVMAESRCLLHCVCVSF
jgi:hypothetical protein